MLRGQRGVLPGRHQVRDRRLGVAAGDQGLADQDRVGAGVGVGDEVVRAADAGLGDLDDVRGDLGGDALEGAAVDLKGLYDLALLDQVLAAHNLPAVSGF